MARQRYAIAAAVRSWKGYGEDRGDTYARKHWFEIDTECGYRMRIYFDRNPARSGSRLGRWWLYSIERFPSKA